MFILLTDCFNNEHVLLNADSNQPDQSTMKTNKHKSEINELFCYEFLVVAN